MNIKVSWKAGNGDASVKTGTLVQCVSTETRTYGIVILDTTGHFKEIPIDQLKAEVVV